MALLGVGAWRGPPIETLGERADCSGRYRCNDYAARLGDTYVVAALGIHSATMTDIAHLDGWMIITRN